MKLLRNLLKGASLTTALFIFQACYGTQSWLADQPDVTFKVVSADGSTPLNGIAIKTKGDTDWNIVGHTYEDGSAQIFATRENNEPVDFRFESEDGAYIVKDTTVTDFSQVIEIKLEKAK